MCKSKTFSGFTGKSYRLSIDKDSKFQSELKSYLLKLSRYEVKRQQTKLTYCKNLVKLKDKTFFLIFNFSLVFFVSNDLSNCQYVAVMGRIGCPSMKVRKLGFHCCNKYIDRQTPNKPNDKTSYQLNYFFLKKVCIQFRVLLCCDTLYINW